MQLDEVERARGNGKTVALPAGFVVYRDPAVAFSKAQWQPEEDDDADADSSQFDIENDILPRLQTLPWTAEQHPVIAATVYKNEAWYADVVSSFTELSAVTYPTFSGNCDNESVSQILLPSTSTNRIFAQRFLLRATLRFGSGQPNDACRDVSFAYKIANRDRLFAIGRFVGASIKLGRLVC